MPKDVKSFLKVKRVSGTHRAVSQRLRDYKDVSVARTTQQSQEQASRCMDCGTPFCHWGCPIGNHIPEWNEYAASGRIKKAYDILAAANPLPEFTGRLCPALCEYACVLGTNDEPITIRENELMVIEEAFAQGLVTARMPLIATGFRVAVIGSGPAGLSAASMLAQDGHAVTVFERDERIGGLLRFGIPDFKLEKWIIDRRVALMEKEGIVFKAGIEVGVTYALQELRNDFDAVVYAVGSRVPRDLAVEGRSAQGIYFAMDYLTQSNRRVAGIAVPDSARIDAQGKRVVVIGGGDTGSDCVGTANRQGARSVTQIELLAKPALERGSDAPWPRYPILLKTTTSHEEGADRQWAVSTKQFIVDKGVVKGLSCVRVTGAKNPQGGMIMQEIPGSGFSIDADMVVLALGFLHPQKQGALADAGLALDARGNIKTGVDYMTSSKGMFACGDARRGQSLVAWAILEGKEAAAAVSAYLRVQKK